MNRTLAAIALVAAAASAAAAQAPPPPELPLPAFLEKRVPEELASEGHVLSRANLTLKVEAAGSVLIVSLVDLNTGRVAASTKLDQLPPDREAAVASVTHVAADLVTQVSGREPAPPPPPPVVIDDRAEREAKEIANLRFHKQMIRFGATYELYADRNTAILHRNWITYQGELEQELEPRDFYRLVGHPDLADAYDRRHNLAIGGAVVGIAGTLAAMIYIIHTQSQPDCQVSDPNFGSCIDMNAKAISDSLAPTLLLTAVGSAGFVFWAWYHFHPHPVSENEAKSLAAQYNDGLRHELGLPVVERHFLHDIRITPYVANNEGGLAFGARF